MKRFLHPFAKPYLLLVSFAALSSLRPTASFAQKTNDSIVVAIAPAYDSVNSFHRFWLGQGYRKIWAAPVRMKVLDLQKVEFAV